MRSSYDRYQTEVKSYLQKLESAWMAYQSSFFSAKEEYDKKKGSYSTFPIPTEGQKAMTEYDRMEAKYKQLRAGAEAAKAAAIPTEEWTGKVASRKETESQSQVRLTGWASVQESMSNRVVWIAWVDHPVSDQNAAVAALLDRLVASLPNESRGAR